MIDTQLLISGVIFGLSQGSIFFLMAIGLSLCFGLMRIISLDQLLYYSVGAYITYSVGLALGNVWLGALGGVVVGGLTALLVERVVFRRIYDRDLPFTMITSFGVLIGGVGVIKYFWGLVPRPVPVPIDVQVYIIGTEIPVYRLVVVAIAALVYIGTRADVRPLHDLLVQRVQEGNGPHEVRCQPAHQQVTFPQCLPDQLEVALFQVAETAVNELGRPRRGARRQVPGLDKADPQATRRRVKRGARPGDAAADDQHVDRPGRQGADGLVPGTRVKNSGHGLQPPRHLGAALPAPSYSRECI